MINLTDVKIYRNKNNDIIKIKSNLRHPTKGIVGSIEVVEGSRVKIIPPNPNKKRNRDRIGTVTGFTTQYRELRAKVQFDDTKGIGKIELDELVIIEE